MELGYQYLLLLMAGIIAICWGLPAAHRLQKPYDVVASLAVFAGLLVALFGLLLVFIPSFFR